MEISTIKQKLQIRTVLNHYRLEADKNGMLLCPFHEDKTASLKIYEKTNSFHCFACGTAGDQIEYIQQYEKIDKHQAIMKAESLLPTQSGQTKNTNPQTPEKDNFPALFTSFKQALARSPKAREYAQSRHLDINRTGIAYNSGTVYKKLKNCLIFPLKNQNGNIVSFYGRSCTGTDSLRLSQNQNTDNTAKHFYTADRTGLYPKYPEPETEILILTESVIDAVTLETYYNKKEQINISILACYGVNGLTEEHKTAIKNLLNLKEIIFFFDGDQAGRIASEKYADEIRTDAIYRVSIIPTISTVQTPENEDINSLLDAHEPEIFSHLINERENIFSPEKPENTDVQPFQPASLNTAKPDFIRFDKGEIIMTVLGGLNIQQLDRMNITLKINFQMNSVRNRLDLYNIDQTERFIQKAADKLECGTSLLNQAVTELTDSLENYREKQIESLQTQKIKKRELSPEQHKKAVSYLKNKDLLIRTNELIGKSGVVGEETNRLLMYLIFTSRMREQPLHIISLGASGTGKTYLQERISELIPESDKKIITILSDNAFYYFERKELSNKLVLIEDMDGAEAVMYALRELMTKKMISKSVTVKDSKGNNKTVNIVVEGPICLAGTTTKERLYEDNANRSILVYLDNSKDQNEKIMDYQRAESAGQIDKQKEKEIQEFFKDIQTVLQPIKVVNPYAKQLKIPDYVFKPLRTNSHYLAFIETVTFYHQYQREIKTDRNSEKYIETTFEDIENANYLIKDVLLAKSDELSKALRDFFETLKKHVNQSGKKSFYSKEIQEKFRIYPMKINRNLRELESRNFICKTGGNRKNGYEYEIYRIGDYEQLKSGLNELDEILRKIKENQV